MAVGIETSFDAHFSVGKVWRARFAAGARRAVEYWLDYVRRHRNDHDALRAENNNILHALGEAAAMPGAWPKAACLALAYDPYMEASGSWRRWVARLTALINAPEAASYPVRQARLRRILATALARLGEVDEAVIQLKQGISPLRAAQAWDPLAKVLLAIAYWRVGAGQFAGVDVYVREAECLARRLNNQPVLIDVHIIHGRRALQDNQHADAIAAFRQALDLARKADHRTLEKAARNFLGMAYLAADQPDAALPHLWSALEIARETGDRPGIGVILVNVGRAYLALDQPTRAMTHLQAGLQRSRRTDNRPAECAVLTTMGDTHHILGESTLAEGCYRQALHLARSLDDPRREARIHQAMAKLHADAVLEA